MARLREQITKLLPDDQQKALDMLDADTSSPRLSDPPPDRSWVPAQGMDRQGMPPLGELTRLETNAFRRLSPRRRRWKKLNEFDERVAELEQRHGRVVSELSELLERQRTAPDRDAEQLARWHVGGGTGERPVSEVDSLAAAIRAAERDRDALQAAITHALEDRVRFVDGHRSKLAGDAAKDSEQAHEHYVASIAVMERAREEFVDCRLTELWALTYPDASAGREPQFLSYLARNLVDRLRRAGVAHGLDVTQLGRLLREDADAVASAIDPEQRAVVEGLDRRSTSATWSGSDEGKARRSAEIEAARQAYQREWGRQPTEVALEAFLRERDPGFFNQ